MPDRLLLVEDTPSLSMLYQSVLTRAGHGVDLRRQPRRGARRTARGGEPRLVLLDLQLPDGDGLELLATAAARGARDPGDRHHRQRLDQPRGAGDARRRLRLPGQAVRRGAAAQRGRRTRSPPRRRRAEEAATPPSADGLPGLHRPLGGDGTTSTGWCARSAARPRPCSSPARAAPARRSAPGRSTRCRPARRKPFVPLNCAAIPRDLLESEVFGHLKGAFTGALSDKPGAAAVADGGTLFLDEICEMDLSLQTKLLRFLQTSTIQPVGAARPIPVDVRIVCATNRDPAEEVRAGPVPRGPLLPAARGADPHAAAARAARGHHRHRPGEPASSSPPRRARPSPASTPRRSAILRQPALARQRAPAPERDPQHRRAARRPAGARRRCCRPRSPLGAAAGRPSAPRALPVAARRPGPAPRDRGRAAGRHAAGRRRARADRGDDRALRRLDPARRADARALALDDLPQARELDAASQRRSGT